MMPHTPLFLGHPLECFFRLQGLQILPVDALSVMHTVQQEILHKSCRHSRRLSHASQGFRHSCGVKMSVLIFF